jgi:hypothetical protein
VTQTWREIAAAAADAVGATDELVPWYEEWVAVAKWTEAVFRARAEAGAARGYHVFGAEAARCEAEHALLKLKQKLGKK